MRLFILFVLPLMAFAQSVQISIWNIEKGKKLDRVRTQFETGVFSESDIFALQEVKPTAELNEFIESLGMMAARAGSDIILSKFPIVSSGELTINDETGRQTVWADISSPIGLVRVYSVHLSFKVKRFPFIKKTRGKEMQVILDHAANAPGHVAIAGDLNTIGCIIAGQSKEPAIKKLKSSGYTDTLHSVKGNTQLAGHFLPMGRIDWIWSKGQGLEVEKSVKGRFSGSDHRWMSTYLTIKE